MEAFFASGRVVDVALVVLLVEAVVLARRGRAASPPPMLWNLLAGAALLLALRAALAGASWPWLAALLTAALVAHALDLLARLRR